VSHNPTPEVRTAANIRWDPGRLSFHPGPKGEYCVVRWTARTRASMPSTPRSGHRPEHHDRRARAAPRRALYDGWINLQGQGKQCIYDGKITAGKGDQLDFVVGWGNGTTSAIPPAWKSV